MLIMEKTKVQKGKNFTQKETELLTGLSRNQLRRLDEIGLLKPAKHPPILYSWEQIVFLRVLSELRQEFTIKQLGLIFKDVVNTSGFKKFVDNLEDTLSILLLVDYEGSVTLETMRSVNFPDDKELTEELRESLEKVKEGSQLPGEHFEIIEDIASNCVKQRLKEINKSKISIKKKTILIMACVIRDIFEAAKTNGIKNFESKVK